MNKYGIASKVFIYAISVFILGLLIIMGVRFLSTINEKANDASWYNFKMDLEDSVDSLRTKNARRTIEFDIGSGYDEVCIVDSNADPNDLSDYPILKNSIMDDAKENLFVFKNNGFESADMPRLKVSTYPYFACYPVSQGKISIELTGKANQVFVFPPPMEEYCMIADGSVPNTCELLDAIYSGYSDRCCEMYEKCC